MTQSRADNLTGLKRLALKQRGCRGWKESQVTGTDQTASVISQRREGFSQDRDQEVFSLVLVVADGGEPPLSSTATLSLRVCVCQRNTRGRHNSVCQAEAFLSSAAIVMLFTQLRNKKASKEPLILSEEDIRENVVTYDDEGGGEEDTEAFDIDALRNPQNSETRRKFHSYYGYRPRPYEEDELEEDELEEEEMEYDEDEVMVLRRGTAQEVDYGNYKAGPEIPEISQSAPSLLLQGQDIIQQILEQKVVQADSDTRGPPYDSLQTYAYEGRGSLTGSVSSLA
ncbi:hypothetical protein F7725_011988 [Dissostichus mawsoni]|uniref:Cadherin Y-type LIR-motif domain-containing protein n=1 Tax=Dissostichus mawsoni TaxID=36200 RepID=A0A7J5ZDJ9_DISMA|nr:hypothetical protein F7725_011988 [Dissostichus mawsoni]